MPLLVAAIIGGLVQALGTLIGRILISLGISYVVYSGFNVAVDQVKSLVQSNMSGVGGQIVAFLAWCWVDKAVGLIFSAYTASMVIKMAGGSTIKKMVMK